MILIEDIIELHAASINDFGGAHGIRDIGLLESAIARPFQTFDGKELYPTPFDKAAALGESLMINHPFIDGNKRIGLLAMLSMLMEFKLNITAQNSELYQFCIDISTGTISVGNISLWLMKHADARAM